MRRLICVGGPLHGRIVTVPEPKLGTEVRRIHLGKVMVYVVAERKVREKTRRALRFVREEFR